MTMNAIGLLHTLAALVLAPLLPAIIARTKARFAGRQGPPLLQGYADLGKLFRKGTVLSRTATWVFLAGPIATCAALATTLAFVPLGGLAAPVSFGADLILVAYLLGVARFVTVLAALDTGSSFEGMGGSREVLVAALAEPALLIGLAALARFTGHFSLGPMIGSVTGPAWLAGAPALALVAAAVFVVMLAENARIPFDDPNTHLELTMIHEVMVLDHSGPALALVHYGAALKLWIFGALLAGIVVPVRTANPWIDGAAALAGIAAIAVVIGVVESTRARVRLRSIPQLLVGAGALSALAMILVLG